MENSSIYQSKPEEELHRVIAHGTLHLLGYNDKTKKEKEIMRSKENEYLTIRK